MDNREKLEKQKQSAEKRRREDAAFTKTLYWLVGAVLIWIYVFVTKRYLIDYDKFGLTEEAVDLAIAVSYVVAAVAAVGLILGVVLIVLAVLRQKKAGHVGTFSWAIAVFFLGLGGTSALIWFYRATAVSLLIYLLPAVGGLALIYYLYQREFFSEALCCTLGYVGTWMILRTSSRSIMTYAALACVVVLLAAVGVFAGVLQSKKGMLALKSGPVRIFPENANYVLVYISCGLALIVMAAALVLGSGINENLYRAALVAWGLVMAVYHTVKLM